MRSGTRRRRATDSWVPPSAGPQNEKGFHQRKLEGEGFGRLDVRHNLLGLKVSEKFRPPDGQTSRNEAGLPNRRATALTNGAG